MGKEVVYCFNCGVRLLYSDFEKGAAFRVKQECACVDCMPLLLEMLPPEEREAFRRKSGAVSPTSATPRRGTGRVPLADGARRSTTRRTRPAGAVPAEEHPEEDQHSPGYPRKILLIGAGAGAALVAGAILVFLLVRKGPPPPEGLPAVEKARAERPPPPPPPRTAEDGAREALAKAREFQARNPGDLEGQAREFQEVAWKHDKTAAGDEARKEAEILRGKIGKGLTPEMEKLLEETRGLLEREEYGKVLEALEKAKEKNTAPAWIQQVDKRIEEAREEAQKKYGEVKQKAQEAREKGEEEEFRKLRERVAKWGIERLAEEFEKAFGKAAEAAKAEPGGPVRDEEGKAYLEKWMNAVGPATNRDYAGAMGKVEQASQGLAGEAWKREAGEDLKDLKEAEAFCREAMKAAAGTAVGQAVKWEVVTPWGSRETVEGVVVAREADHLEVRKEGRKEATYVDPLDLSGPSLVKAAQGTGRAAALFLLLEGEAEGAKALGAAGIAEKYWEYARTARERAPRADGGEAGKEREAKQLFWGAGKEYGKMETLGGAIEKYKVLAKEYIGAGIVRKNIELITVRSEAGKEYFLLAGDLKGSGAVGMASHPELETCWTCREDVADSARAQETYVELEFWALAGTPYQSWVYAGGCCEETFVMYLQATDMMGPNPKKRSEQVSYDVGRGVAAPVEPKARGLKKTHAQHGGGRQGTRWEWIAIPLPKYAAGGLKKVRLMTERKGFSVGMALVSSLRKGPPKAEELREEIPRAREEAKARVRVDPTLVGHWKLDDVAWGSTPDSSGKGSDGRISGNPKPVPGKIEGALELDGAGDFVSVAHQPSLNAYPLTASAWFRTTSTFGGHTAVVNKYKAGSMIGWQIHCFQGAVRAWYFKDRGSHAWDGRDGIGGGRVNDGAWHHAAFVVDASGGRLYLDGVSIADRAWTGTPGPPATTEDLSLGRYPGDAPLFKGAVDDVRIYNRALSAPEVEALFKSGRDR